MQVRLLGPVDVTVDGVARAVSGLRRKAVLAVLGLHAREIVSADRLIDVVWGEQAPATARSTVQRHVSYLRRAVGVPAAIVARAPGYALEVAGEATDVAVAERLIRQGRQEPDRVRGAALLRAALAMWRGRPLVDVAGVAWLDEQAERLAGLELTATRALVEVRLALGEHVPLVPELEVLAGQHPFDEEIHGQLMLALYRAGRQADALAVFRRVRRLLGDELGIDPGPALRDIEAAILRQDAELDTPRPPDMPRRVATDTPAIAVTPAVAPARVVPAQLPAGVAGFAGRVAELARLDAVLAGPGSGAVVTSVVSGTAGVGKTALAVCWAHRVADRFPDGQLYVNLRGFDPGGSPMNPAEAVRRFLDALGVAAQRIPSELDAQAALYRSTLAGRRVLVVLDNARDVEQVRPLLPGSPGCLVVVTSRDELTPLVAIEGAYPLALDLLSPDEARDLLSRRLGPSRLAAEPAAVGEIVARCAGLPLALAIVAARVASRPGLALAALAAELGRAVGLDALYGGDAATDVRLVFSWSYRTLSEPAATLFRLLGLQPGPDIAAPAAASLAGLPVDRTRALLVELTQANLLTEHAPGRYALHDLLRAYATEQTCTQDTDAERHAAVHRVLDYYAHAAFAAARMLDPTREPVDLVPARPEVTVQDFIDHGSAMRWLTAEHPGLLAAAEQAGHLGFDAHARQLAWTLGAFFHRRGHWHDWARAQRAALAAASRGTDRPGQANALRGLARAYARLGRNDEAFARARDALDLFAGLGDHAGQARTHLDLAWMSARHGDHRAALGHSQQGLDLFRSANHQDGQSIALNNIGMAHARLGEHQQALSYCRQALDLSREVGNRLNAADSWDSLGCVYHDLGRYQKAVDCYQHALDGFRECEHLDKEARTLSHMADAHHAAGRHAAATEAWQRSLAILTELDPDHADRVRAKLASFAPDNRSRSA